MAKLNSLEDLKSLFPNSLPESELEEVIETEKEADYGTKKLHVQYERKGRGGKEVCVISGFDCDEEQIKVLAKALKQVCGLGGSVKDQSILMQGKSMNAIEAYLKKQGFQVSRNV